MANKKKKKDRTEEKAEQLKKTGIWFGIVAVILASVWVVYKVAESSSTPVELADPVTQEDWIKGAENAEVTVVEYSDFQCPACGHYYPMVKQLLEEYPEDVRLAYRHLPLRQAHPYADLAARAAEAAGLQGKFFPMHDLLFENQASWSASADEPVEQFVSYAEELDLDMEQFRRDLESGAVAEAVEADYRSGLRSQVNATPTFFVNGEEIANPRSYEGFRALVAEILGEN